MTIFVDMDGVLADFDGGLYTKYGIKNCSLAYSTPWDKKSQGQKDLGESIVSVMKKPGFFYDLLPLPGYWDLWRAAEPDVYSLTATPGISEEVDARVAQDKKKWGFKYLGVAPNRIVTCLRSEKKGYAKGNILIDDLEKNVSEWEHEGGIGILYKNAEQAIRELKHLRRKERFDVV